MARPRGSKDSKKRATYARVDTGKKKVIKVNESIAPFFQAISKIVTQLVKENAKKNSK